MTNTDKNTQISGFEKNIFKENSTDLERKLRTRMKITKSNKFNYAKRLENKTKIKSLTINLLSLLTVISGVYLLAFSIELPPIQVQFIGVFSIGVSIVSIMLSLQGSVQETSKRATDAHRCGREISHVYRQLESKQLDLEKASQKYEEIISKYEDNHDRCDYMKTLWDYKFEMKDEKDEKSANIINGIIYSYISSFSPILFAAIGVSLVLFTCTTLPIMLSKL